MVLPCPGASAPNWTVLLSFVIISGVGVSFACDDTGNVAPEAAKEDNSTTPVDSSETLTDIDIAEGSRATGGTPATPPLWMINLWTHEAEPPKELDGKFVGFGLRLTNHSFLAADVSCLMLERWYFNIKDRLPIELRVPEKINVAQGPAHTYRNYLGCAFRNAVGILEGESTGFSVFDFKLQLRYRYDVMDAWDIPHGAPIKNDTTVDKDCILYAYSSNPKPGSPQEERIFSKYQVKLLRCKRHNANVCRFQFYSKVRSEFSGAICPLFSDVGAPIVCNGKVSYVVTTQDRDGCYDTFYALSLEPFQNQLRPTDKWIPG